MSDTDPTAPTLEEVQAMPDDESIEVERRLIEETDNSPRPEDGDQPSQDEEPELDGDDDA